MEHYFLNVEKNLSKLDISSLVECLGEELAEQMDSLDMPIHPANLAKVLLKLKGTSIFQDKVIRKHFCNLANKDEISTWNQSDSCKDLLDFYGLPQDFLPDIRKKRKLLESSYPNFTLHDFQDFIKRRVSKFLFNSSKKMLMVQMPTGSGKTFTTMESIFDFLRISEDKSLGVIWMAHTDELCEQAIESFNKGWESRGTSNIDLLRLWGGNANQLDNLPKGSFFAVTSFQTANSMLKTRHDAVFETYSRLRARNGLLIVDEAHMSLAPTYKLAIQLFSGVKSKVVGLTATPGRHGVEGDNQETLELVEFYESNILSLSEFTKEFDKKPIDYLQDQGVLAHIKQLKLETNSILKLTEKERSVLGETLTLPDSALKRIGKDHERNTLILAQIAKLVVNEKKKLLVFASSKSNSDLLASMLIMRDIEARSITSDTNFSDRVKSVEAFKKGEIQVLINFNVFTTGFDDPTIDCVVIARPTFSVVLYSQMIGRGLRGPLNGGTKDCLIVDVIDNLENQPELNLASEFFSKEWELED
tara:strand:- start:2043 stop:3635 length:1593 start_codon:yes stop_codon:yes gene_type:complete